MVKKTKKVKKNPVMRARKNVEKCDTKYKWKNGKLKNCSPIICERIVHYLYYYNPRSIIGYYNPKEHYRILLMWGALLIIITLRTIIEYNYPDEHHEC